MPNPLARLWPRALARKAYDRYAYLRSMFLEGYGAKGVRPRPFAQDRATKKFGAWCYVAAMLNAQAFASVPLKLYVRRRDAEKYYRTRTPGRRARAYLAGDTKEVPSGRVLRKIADFGGDFEEVVEEHPATELLRRVSPWMNGFEMQAVKLLYLQFCGNHYQHHVLDRNTGVPAELWPMPAHLMEIMPCEEEFVKGYRFGRDPYKHDFAPDEVLHWRLPTIGDDPYYGVGKVQAAWSAIGLHEAKRTHDLAFYENMARPDWVLGVDGAHGDALREIEASVEEKYRGPGNSGKMIAVGGKVTAYPLNMPVKDIGDPDRVIEEIAAAFGVPITKLLANDPNRANAATGDAGWLRDTILPYCRMDEEVLNEQYLPLWGITEDAVLAYENPVPRDQAFDLQERQVALAGSAYKTVNEVREDDGLDPLPGGDVLPLGQAGAGGMGMGGMVGSPMGMGEETVPGGFGRFQLAGGAGGNGMAFGDYALAPARPGFGNYHLAPAPQPFGPYRLAGSNGNGHPNGQPFGPYHLAPPTGATGATNGSAPPLGPYHLAPPTGATGATNGSAPPLGTPAIAPPGAVGGPMGGPGMEEGPATPVTPEQAPALASNDLRATVGGSAQVLALQQAYYGGALPREAAIANAQLVFGFSHAEAAELFPEKAPEPPGGPPPGAMPPGMPGQPPGAGGPPGETGQPGGPTPDGTFLKPQGFPAPRGAQLNTAPPKGGEEPPADEEEAKKPKGKAAKNCGTGSGGFAPGNDCAGGGEGSGDAPNRTTATEREAALRVYTHDGFSEVNGLLRAGIEPAKADKKWVQGVIDGLDDHIALHGKPIDKVLYRGLVSQYMPPIANGVLVDNGFMSTSSQRARAEEAAYGERGEKVLLEISAGAFGAGTFDGGKQAGVEYEYILPRGSKFEVVGKRSETTEFSRQPITVYELKPIADTPSKGKAYAPAQKYGWVGVPVPEPLAGICKQLAAAIPDADLAGDGRATEPHLTLFYGLHGDDPGAVTEALAGAGAAPYTLGGIGIFEGVEDGAADCVHLAVTGDALHALNKRLGMLPNTTTQTAYKPHVTLAYVKPGAGKKYAACTARLDADAVATAAVFTDAVGNRHPVAWEAANGDDGDDE